MSHTPEPWKVDPQYPTDIYAEPDAHHIGPSLIAQVKTVDYYKDGKSNAARIVAAVNGCAGLNPAAYRKCVDLLQRIARGVCLRQEVSTGCICYTCSAQAVLTHAEPQP